MLVPSRRLIVLYAVIGAMAFIEPLQSLSLILAILLCLAALLDGLRIYRLPELQWQRRWPQPMTQGQSYSIRIDLQSERTQRLQWMDQLPEELTSSLPQLDSELSARNQSLSYRLYCAARGQHRIHGVRYRLTTYWRLWWKQFSVTREESCAVWPATARALALLNSQRGHQSRSNSNSVQRAGLGFEFLQLREFQNGDSSQHIDWKASARQHQLISREFSLEPDQDLLILLDCGLGMWSEDSEGRYFDRVLDALIALFNQALSQQRRIGLLLLQGQQVRYLPAQRSKAQLQKLMQLVFDLQPSTDVSNYLAVVACLRRYHIRRSELVLLTQLGDLQLDELQQFRRQLPAGLPLQLIGLQQSELQQALQQPLFDFDDALSYFSLSDYLTRLEQQIEQLRQSHLPVTVIHPQQVFSQLLRHYRPT